MLVETGIVIADGKNYGIKKLDCVYLGKGTKEVQLKVQIPKALRCFICFRRRPIKHIRMQLYTKENAAPVALGECGHFQ